MGKVTVQVWDATGNKRQDVELPDDAPVNRILAVLLERMKFPQYAPDGQPLSYKFHHRASENSCSTRKRWPTSGLKTETCCGFNRKLPRGFEIHLNRTDAETQRRQAQSVFLFSASARLCGYFMSDRIQISSDALNAETDDRFHRFKLISWWDQTKLKNAKVLVVGAGALGNEIIKNLALLGIGNVLIADLDTIENSNLSRSVLYRKEDNGKPKSTVAAAAASGIYPDQKTRAFVGNVVYDLGLGVYHWADVVIGGLDNREARLSINRNCWKCNTPWVDGAIQQIDGVARVFVPETHPLGKPEAACYECTMSPTDWKLLQQRRSCNLLSKSEMVAGKTPTTPTISSVIAGVQCQEAVKILHGMHTFAGQGWVFNGLSADSYLTEYQKKQDCFSHDPLEEIITMDWAAETTTVGQALEQARRLLGETAELAIFRAQVELLRATYGIEPGEIDLCTFPLFALFAPALGMTSVVPEMNFTRPGRVDPTRIIQAVDDFGVTNLFGSPALIRRVGDYGAKYGIKLTSLRRVISAGAPVPAAVLATFGTMLRSEVELFTPYGATESLPVASIGSHAILGETRAQTEVGRGVCVGRPVAGMEAAIIRIDDGPIATWSDSLRVPIGTIGEIAVCGPVVTRSYFGRPEATALAKIAEGDRVWHRMGDVGTLDESGRIWFCGRKAHRVVTPDRTLFTIPVEGIFNTHPAVARTALVGVGPPGKARPVVCVELREKLSRRAWEKVRLELVEIGRGNPVTQGLMTFLRHPSFPVDIRHNAKIFREKLAVWATRELA